VENKRISDKLSSIETRDHDSSWHRLDNFNGKKMVVTGSLRAKKKIRIKLNNENLHLLDRL